MSEDQLTITQLLEYFRTNGNVPKDNGCYLFYDWFCHDTSLEKKAYTLLKRLQWIAGSKKFDNDKTYVWFKNNCPMVGELYDDFRIADIKTGDTIFTVIPSSGFTNKKGMAEVWGISNNFNGPLFEGKWREAIDWFMK